MALAAARPNAHAPDAACGAHVLGNLQPRDFVVALFGIAILTGLNNGYALRDGSAVQQRLMLTHLNMTDPLYESNMEAQLLSAALMIGIVVGAGFTYPTVVLLGTRTGSMLGETCRIVSAAIGVAAGGDSGLLVWRILLGIGVGQCIALKPLYLAETAMPSVRGRVLAALALAIYAGQMLLVLVDQVRVQPIPRGSSLLLPATALFASIPFSPWRLCSVCARTYCVRV